MTSVMAGKNFPFTVRDGLVYDEEVGERHETLHLIWRQLPSGWTPAMGMHFTRAEFREMLAHARRRWGASVCE